MFRTVSFAAKNLANFRKFSTTPNALGGTWTYRSPPPPPSKVTSRLSEIMMALSWYWVIYHCITQYDHLIGEFEYPDPSKWTDEELGIPPDNEE